MSNCDYLVFKGNVLERVLHNQIAEINQRVFKGHLDISYPEIGDKNHCIVVSLGKSNYGFQIWRESARTIYAEKIFSDLNYWIESVLFNELGLALNGAYQWNDGSGNAPEDRWYPEAGKYGDNTLAGYTYWRTKPFRDYYADENLESVLQSHRALFEEYKKMIPQELRGEWKQ